MSDQQHKPPKTPPYSDINLNEWRNYNHILTDSLWLFPARAKTGGHQLEYHGNYIPQIATQLFTRYTKANEIVLDMFLGAGTSALEAVNLGRKCIGVELKPDLVAHVRQRIPAAARADVRLVTGDSTASETVSAVREALTALGSESAHFLMLHPPYADIIKFSDLPNDLSNAPSVDAFLDAFEQVARNGYELLADGRFAAVIIGDKYANGELQPLGFWCMERMMRVGFKAKAIIVKDIRGNEKGKGRSANLWRYRALAGGYYIFKHEYIFVMQKPAKRRKR